MHHFPKWCIIAPSFRGGFSSLSLWKPKLQVEFMAVGNQPYQLRHRRHKSERARLVLIFHTWKAANVSAPDSSTLKLPLQNQDAPGAL
ncbi:hypothetical protein D3Z58_24520 [Clostridiaceae bacterium]|nr:hypothetical protein [Clostridiaceae bacterium]